ncbi:hypothetical protein J6590_030544 [Homalodisca vitripennis]|nr:hypothetical protein J6590_030544 [Homalodisca vitripennis]
MAKLIVKRINHPIDLTQHSFLKQIALHIASVNVILLLFGKAPRRAETPGCYKVSEVRLRFKDRSLLMTVYDVSSEKWMVRRHGKMITSKTKSQQLKPSSGSES